MNEQRRGYIVGLVAGFLGLASIYLINHFAQPSTLSRPVNPVPHAPAFSSPIALPASQQVLACPELYSSSGVLELPMANPDFVGYWGGFVHNSGALTADDSDHVGVVFGRRAGKVFFASDLYSPKDQHILGTPRARMASSKEAVIEYESEDDEIDYRYSHRFRLLDSGRMSYQETVYLYEREEHHLLGIAEHHSLLKRLTTVNEWRFFSRPAPGDVREGEISATR